MKTTARLAALLFLALAPLAAPAAETEAKWAYTDFGAPGKVVKREQVADLDRAGFDDRCAR